MCAYSPSKHLAELKESHPRLLYYPNCGHNHINGILNLPYDTFIFSTPLEKASFWPQFNSELEKNNQKLNIIHRTPKTRTFEVGNKLGFLFFKTEEDTLKTLRLSQRKISCYLGISNECRKHENPDDCVNSRGFLEKVTAISEPEFDFYIDHVCGNDIGLLGQNPKALPRSHYSFSPEDPWYVACSAQMQHLNYQFSLREILVRPGQGEWEDAPEEFSIPHTDGTYQSGFENDPTKSDLWKLLPFRYESNHPIIARYRVSRQ